MYSMANIKFCNSDLNNKHLGIGRIQSFSGGRDEVSPWDLLNFWSLFLKLDENFLTLQYMIQSQWNNI